MTGRSGGRGSDFGENFVERERQYRFRKSCAPVGRAKSEVGETMSIQASNGRMRRDFCPTYTRGPGSLRGGSSSSFYERPRSSFEPSRVLKNRPDDWCEVEERQRRYGVPTQQDFSGAEDEQQDEEELTDGDDDSREEMSSYNFQSGKPQPPATYQSISGGSNYRRYGNGGVKRNPLDFDDREVYFFGVIQLSPDRARSILASNPPPVDYAQLNPIERTAYLYYFTLYRKYLTPVSAFHKVFNREFYKYTCEGDSDDAALWKICKHTHEEYKRRMIKRNQQAYKLTQKHLFSDERDTPDSRTSDRPSFGGDQESDLNSLDSSSREPLFYRVPHAPISFGLGGKLIYVSPENSVSTVRIEDAKNFFRDSVNHRLIEAMESFKGPLVVGETPPHTPLLFIQRQIERILQSDVYRGNPSSGDANDCLLIWYLLEVLVRQHGKVTGPDLARLLVQDNPYAYTSAKSFTRQSLPNSRAEVNEDSDRVEPKDEREADPHAMDRFTRFLLGGHVEEAIEHAMNDGLLFDALFMAHRMFRHDPRRLDAIETKLLSFRNAQHPTMTLMSVAAEQPVPLLASSHNDHAGGWRVHAAIVLANLQTPTAISTIHQLGLALAQKEFNSAADFCFLVVNLLSGVDCFRDPMDSLRSNGSHEPIDPQTPRRHIHLISASLPDDELHSTVTRFGWSILDLQATEIFDYAVGLALAPMGTCSALAGSVEFQHSRLQYAQMLSELGGFSANVLQYCVEISKSVWALGNEQLPKAMLEELVTLAERFAVNQGPLVPQIAWDLFNGLKGRLGHNRHRQEPVGMKAGSVLSSQPPHAIATQPANNMATPITKAQADPSFLPLDHQPAPHGTPPKAKPTPPSIPSSHNEPPAPRVTRNSHSSDVPHPPPQVHSQRPLAKPMSQPSQPLPPPQQLSFNGSSFEDDDDLGRSRSASLSDQFQHGLGFQDHGRGRTESYSSQVFDEPNQHQPQYQQQWRAPVEAAEQYGSTSNGPSEAFRFSSMEFTPSEFTETSSPFVVNDPQRSSESKTKVKDPFSDDENHGEVMTTGVQHSQQQQHHKQQQISQGAAGSSGVASWNLKNMINKLIPAGGKSMILPADNNPEIVFNKEKNCWEGPGIEQPAAIAPPPTMAALNPTPPVQAPQMVEEPNSGTIPLIPAGPPAAPTAPSASIGQPRSKQRPIHNAAYF